MKKKILALCLVVVLVATAITGVTLAYFNDYTDVATNTFTVGNIDIKLDEKDIKNPGERTEKGNTYENVYPGQTVYKDPTVTFVEDSRDCYVRMIVTLEQEELTALETAFPTADYATYWAGDIFLLQYLVNGWDNGVWEPHNTSKGHYEFWYVGPMATDGVISAENAKAGVSLEALFNSITFPEDMTNTEIAALNKFDVNIVAHAMQADGFDTAEAAWDEWVKEDQQ